MKTLLFLILMTGVCLADEPEIIDYKFSGYSPILNSSISYTAKTTDINFFSLKNNYTVINISPMDLNNTYDIVDATIKVSCPDGYELKISKSGKIINDGYIFTDAEFKCVKETK